MSKDKDDLCEVCGGSGVDVSGVAPDQTWDACGWCKGEGVVQLEDESANPPQDKQEG